MLAGDVLVSGVPVTKAGTLVDETVEIALRQPDHPWVGRGGIKLAHGLDAQRDLIQARNGRTGALVNHTIARLRFWRDMGILSIREDGGWEEVETAKGN